MKLIKKKQAYISKHKFNRKNKVILLMITEGEKWRHLVVKISFLLRGITIKSNGCYYFINCLHSFRIENKLKSHENVCKNHDYCYLEMPQKDN